MLWCLVFFHPVLIILVFSPFFGWVSSLFCPLCLSLVSLVVSLSVCVQSPSLYLFTFVCVYSAFLFPVYFITCFFISHGPCLFLQSCPLVCLVSPCPVVLVPIPSVLSPFVYFLPWIKFVCLELVSCLSSYVCCVEFCSLSWFSSPVFPGVFSLSSLYPAYSAIKLLSGSVHIGSTPLDATQQHITQA